MHFTNNTIFKYYSSTNKNWKKKKNVVWARHGVCQKTIIRFVSGQTFSELYFSLPNLLNWEIAKFTLFKFRTNWANLTGGWHKYNDISRLISALSANSLSTGWTFLGLNPTNLVLWDLRAFNYYFPQRLWRWLCSSNNFSLSFSS